MAMNWEKFKKPVERRKPIIFLINESVTYPGTVFRGDKYCVERKMLTEAFNRMIYDFKKNNIRADVAVVTFGNSVNLLLPYTRIVELPDDMWNKIANLPIPNEAVFGTGMLAVKEYLEDLDETPQYIYKPTIIFMTSNEPSQGWESCLETFLQDGRSSKSQRLAVFTPYDGERDVLFKKNEGKTSDNGEMVSDNTKVMLMDTYTNVIDKAGDVKNKAVKAFAEKGVILKKEEYSGDSWVKHMTGWLSFDELDETAPMVEIKKPEDDIPVLEDANFDGNSLDENSYI